MEKSSLIISKNTQILADQNTQIASLEETIKKSALENAQAFHDLNQIKSEFNNFKILNEIQVGDYESQVLSTLWDF